ncbi:hypothetical protein HHL22_08605 [Hymenobacter sp. RP-2-7]|uniref:Uncharacterized protein n=1 Tax=Hymenobacter polaris TaxID=2682546 RepID=A0A7Y0FLX0_9BACT|nr:hypothetical protein [Hymenobacter polaris]NML65262.1 hypothetical protein [Hymenobacter polaris]
MALCQFSQLTHTEKIRVLAASGTRLARRWNGGGCSPYHLPSRGRGFYVEVRYAPGLNSLEVMRSSAYPALLDAYPLPRR